MSLDLRVCCAAECTSLEKARSAGRKRGRGLQVGVEGERDRRVGVDAWEWRTSNDDG